MPRMINLKYLVGKCGIIYVVPQYGIGFGATKLQVYLVAFGTKKQTSMREYLKIHSYIIHNKYVAISNMRIVLNVSPLLMQSLYLIACYIA